MNCGRTPASPAGGPHLLQPRVPRARTRPWALSQMLRRLWNDDPQIREAGWEAGATAATGTGSLKPPMGSQEAERDPQEGRVPQAAQGVAGRGQMSRSSPRPHGHPAQWSQTRSTGLQVWGGARHKGHRTPLRIGEPGGAGAVGPPTDRRLSNPEVLSLTSSAPSCLPLAIPRACGMLVPLTRD